MLIIVVSFMNSLDGKHQDKISYGQFMAYVKDGKIERAIVRPLYRRLLLEADGTEYRNYSDEAARVIDMEVMAFVKEAEDRAKNIINNHRPLLDKLANLLLEKVVINQEEMVRLFKK